MIKVIAGNVEPGDEPEDEDFADIQDGCYHVDFLLKLIVVLR